MQIGSILQAYGFQSGYLPATEKIAGGMGEGGGNLPPSSAGRVDISSAAKLRLASEQQVPNTGEMPASVDLPVGIRHMLERMVDNPVFGAKYAEGYAANVHTAAMSIEDYMRGRHTLEAGSKELQAAWQQISSQGKSPAESYADLLRYELNMPRSYWEAMDPGHAGVRELAESKLAYIRQYMASKA